MAKVKRKKISFLFVSIIVCLTYVFVSYIVDSSYPMPKQCRRLPSSFFKNYDITEDQSRQLRKLMKTCFPLDSAFLVYKDTDVGTEKSRFKQGFNLFEYMSSFTTSNTGTNSMVNKSHFNSINFQRDCAIVGNGGILIGSKCGKNINNHNFVLRSNLAPIVNYEDDVGIKTNMTVLNGQIIDQVINTVDQKGALGKRFLERIQYLNDSILWYSKDTRVYFKKRQLQFLSKMLKNKYNLPIQFGYSWRSVDPLTKWFWSTGIDVPHLTTGFNTFTVAASLCDNVTLYGFYPFYNDTNGKPLLYHYYDKTDVLGNHRVHNMPKEYELLTQLNASGVLRLVTHCN